MTSAPSLPISLEYAVVIFSNGEYSEVPVKWLVKAVNDEFYSSCWWPKDKKCTSALIKEKVDPDAETWEMLAVTVDKFCSTYQSARKRAEDSSFSSAEEKELGKGKRAKKTRKFFSSDEGKRKSVDGESDDDENEFSLTAIPEVPEDLEIMDMYQPYEKQSEKEKSRSKTKKFKQGEDYSMIETMSNLATQEQPGAETSEISREDEVQPKQQDSYFPVNDAFQKDLKNMFETMKRMWADIKIQQLDVIKRLGNLEKRTSSLSSEDLNLIKSLLPLKSMGKVDEFNMHLKNTEYEFVFKKYVKQIGGGTYKEAINNTLAHVLKNKCARKYTWKGKNDNKAAAKDLPFIISIRETLCVVHENLTETDFNTCASEWFRLANQRYIREQNRKNKASQNADQP